MIEEGKQKSLRGARIGDKITDAGGDIAKTLRYTKKNGKVIWLEEGIEKAPGKYSGWKHFTEEIRPGDTTTRFEQFKKANVGVNSEKELQDLMFDVIENGTPTPDPKGGYRYTKSINSLVP